MLIFRSTWNSSRGLCCMLCWLEREVILAAGVVLVTLLRKVEITYFLKDWEERTCCFPGILNGSFPWCPETEYGNYQVVVLRQPHLSAVQGWMKFWRVERKGAKFSGQCCRGEHLRVVVKSSVPIVTFPYWFLLSVCSPCCSEPVTS